jgi:glycosyltransferase involved in cell wall biosynthesis
MRQNRHGLLRIALAGDYPLDPNKISGGPQAVFTYLLEGLRQFKELDLHVVSAHKEVIKSSEFQQGNVTFHFLSHPRLPFELAYLPLQEGVCKILRKIGPDLVHAQSDIYGAICLKAGYPTVTTVHSISGSESRFGSGRIIRTRLALHAKLISYLFLSNARHIISNSEYIRQGLVASTQANFYSIDNPVATAFFRLSPDEAVPGRVLFVGFLREVKRPDRALETFALARQFAPELHLQFAGAAIEPKLEARMRGFIARHELERHVEFLGHLQETRLLEAYQQTSILLLTSDLENSPMAIEQAMAAGKAVVATAVGGIPFLVDDGRTGILVDPQKPAKIAQALVRLNRDHDLRRKIGQAARQEALERFKPEIVAAKTFSVYQEILPAKM